MGLKVPSFYSRLGLSADRLPSRCALRVPVRVGGRARAVPRPPGPMSIALLAPVACRVKGITQAGEGQAGPALVSVSFLFCLVCSFIHTFQWLVSNFCTSPAQAQLWQRYQDANISDFSLFRAHRRPRSHLGGTYKGGTSLYL